MNVEAKDPKHPGMKNHYEKVASIHDENARIDKDGSLRIKLPEYMGGFRQTEPGDDMIYDNVIVKPAKDLKGNPIPHVSDVYMWNGW